MKNFLTLILILCGCSQPIAWGALELELTQGINAAMPIAVVPFAGQNNDSTATNIAKIIQSDLTNSGRFKTINMDRMQQTPSQIGEVKFDYWQSLSVDDIVIGNVRPLSNGQYQVSFSLLDIFKGSKQGNSPVLITKEYTVPASEFRRLAHHISDAIYQQLTGQKGIFSTRIAYILVNRQPNGKAQHTLEVADFDGFNPRPLLVSNEPIMSPAWSHDGKKVAYVSFENKKASIYVQEVSTGHRQILTSFPGLNNAPAWSPDGTKIALVLSKTGAAKIYLFDLTTRKLRQITNGNSIDTEPFFSPDNRSILFTSDRGGSPQIYQFNLGNEKIQRLTFDGRYNASSSFSPDGKSIVVLHGSQNDYNVAIQDLNSGGLTLLTRTGNTSSPSMAPNGQMILYADNSGDRGMLGIVSIDGKVRLRIPAPEGSVQEPAWSPFIH